MVTGNVTFSQCPALGYALKIAQEIFVESQNTRGRSTEKELNKTLVIDKTSLDNHFSCRNCTCTP